MRWSPVEAAVAFAVTFGILAAMAPSCLRSVRTSRSAEATENLDRLATAVRDHLSDPARKPLMPTPLTPPIVPRGAPTSDPAGTWEHPTWQALSFQLDVPHWYAYQLEIDEGAQSVKIIAHGDLDGDGVLSTYERQVRREGNAWVVSPALVVSADLE